MAIIGQELINSDVVALIELVKNSFDADARMVLIRLTGGLDADGPDGAAGGMIEILDDGHGMTDATVRETWLEPATGFRRKHPTTPDGRRVLGEKGVGRFATAKVGDRLDLTSKSVGADEVHLAVDWSAFEDDSKYLDEIELQFEVRHDGMFRRGGSISATWEETAALHLGGGIRPPTGERGTLLSISGLRSAWTPESVRKLELHRWLRLIGHDGRRGEAGAAPEGAEAGRGRGAGGGGLRAARHGLVAPRRRRGPRRGGPAGARRDDLPGALRRHGPPRPARGLPPEAAEALPAAQASGPRGAKAQTAGRLQAPSRPSGEPNASASTSTLEVPIYGYVTCQ